MAMIEAGLTENYPNLQGVAQRAHRPATDAGEGREHLTLLEEFSAILDEIAHQLEANQADSFEAEFGRQNLPHEKKVIERVPSQEAAPKSDKEEEEMPDASAAREKNPCNKCCKERDTEVEVSEVEVPGGEVAAAPSEVESEVAEPSEVESGVAEISTPEECLKVSPVEVSIAGTEAFAIESRVRTQLGEKSEGESEVDCETSAEPNLEGRESESEGIVGEEDTEIPVEEVSSEVKERFDQDPFDHAGSGERIASRSDTKGGEAPEERELLEGFLRSILAEKNREPESEQKVVAQRSLGEGVVPSNPLYSLAEKITSKGLALNDRTTQGIHTASAEKPQAQEGGEGRVFRQLTRSLQSRTMERVEKVLKEAAKSRDGKSVSVRLDPPDLGSVKVDVSMRDGNLHARMTIDSQQVAHLLRERLFELQGLLRKLGLNVDSVTVSVNSPEDTLDGGGAELGFGESTGGRREQRTSGDSPAESGRGVPFQDEEFEQGRAPVMDHWVA